MLPDWSPGFHPLVVHFPVALLVVAALADVLAVSLRLARRRAAGRGLHGAAVGLYALGAVAAVAAYRTGNAASETVSVPADALALLSAHADAAWVLVWAAGAFALVRVGVLALRARRWADARALHVALALVGVAGLGLLYQTAARGGELVYRHGVGVAAVPAAASPAAAADVVPDAAGAWAWEPDGRLPPSARVLAGTADAVARPPGGTGLAVVAPLMVTLGPPVGDVAPSADLDLSAFAGAVRLVHHVQGAQTYDFVSVERATATPGPAPTTVRLGRVAGGTETVYDAVTSAQPGRVTLALSAVGTHFLGGVGDAPRAHGHDAAAAAGPVGLSVDGSGPVLVHRLSATPVAAGG